MATIDDYGGAGGTLANPPLGGPDGWAAAVVEAIKAARADVAQAQADVAQAQAAAAAASARVDAEAARLAQLIASSTDTLIVEDNLFDAAPVAYDAASGYSEGAVVLFEHGYFLAKRDTTAGQSPTSNPGMWMPLALDQSLVKVSHALSKADADALYLQLATGGRLLGPLTTQGSAQAPPETKYEIGWHERAIVRMTDYDGYTITLLDSGQPTATYAFGQYGQLKLPKATADGDNALVAATKGYVDAKLASGGGGASSGGGGVTTIGGLTNAVDPGTWFNIRESYQCTAITVTPVENSDSRPNAECHVSYDTVNEEWMVKHTAVHPLRISWIGVTIPAPPIE